MSQAPLLLERMVRKLESRSPLSSGDKAALCSLPFKIRAVEPGTYLIREGEQPAHCGVLVSGFAYRHKMTGEGARQIVALHIPGEFFDLQNLFLNVSDHNVQTLTRGEVALVPRSAVQELAMQRPSVGTAMWIDTLVDASIFREWVMNVGRRDSRTRVAHVLCEFALRLEAAEMAEEYRYELPMTQEQLADAVGLTPVHVNRVLKSLGEEGLIRRDKRHVSIPDWDRLRDVGDFSERYLHMHQNGAGSAVA